MKQHGTTHTLLIHTKHDDDSQAVADCIAASIPWVVDATVVETLEPPTYSFTEACQGTVNVHFHTHS